jgi:hypothetical protein
MENTMAQLMSRRNALRVAFGGGAMLLSGCVSPDMMGAVTGGSGKKANWASLIKEARDAIDLVADQTLNLLTVQKEYATVFKLKDLAAKLQSTINSRKTGNINNVSFVKSADKLTKTAQKAISKEIGKKAALSAQQKRVLANGLAKHQKSIEKAWVGGIKMAKVLIEAQSAQKPSFKDIEAVNYMREIVSDLPMAIKFLKTSKSTYESYAKAFEYDAKVPLPAARRTMKLAPMSMGT